MANIKISELNNLSKKDYEDLVPIVDVSANETKKISIEELVDNNVNLIAVSNTAPLECSTGDKYYNTTTNLIYTAIATDTWGGTGEEAVEGIMYIVFEDQVTYAYNGETLISVGGGAGTYVGDTPPGEPKENDLWVDTDDDEYLAEVDDEVSTTSTNAVQNQAITNYVDNLNTYTDSDKIVGEWVDGKPIYRRTIHFSGTITSNDFGISINPTLNMDTLVDAKGVCKYSGSWRILGASYYNAYDTYNIFIWNVSSSQVSISMSNSYKNNVSEIYVTVDYTKASS